MENAARFSRVADAGRVGGFEGSQGDSGGNVVTGGLPQDHARVVVVFLECLAEIPVGSSIGSCGTRHIDADDISLDEIPGLQAHNAGRRHEFDQGNIRTVPALAEIGGVCRAAAKAGLP